MKELLNKLQEEYQLSPAQAQSILTTISGYIKEKFPMVGGAIDQFFPQSFTPEGPGTTQHDVQQPAKGASKLADDFLG